MEFYTVYRHRADGTSECAEIQAIDLPRAFKKAKNWWHDAQRILIAVPDLPPDPKEMGDEKIKEMVFAYLDKPLDKPLDVG